VTGGAEEEARAFLAELEGRAAPLNAEANRAWWDAATGGGEAALERSTRARAESRALLSDPDAARRIRGWLASDEVRDPLLRRQLVVLDLEVTPNQLPRETIDRLVADTAELERVFYTFRAEIDGERVTNNRIVDILSTERNSDARRAAWNASRAIGEPLAEPLRAMVRARNAAARQLGYTDAYAMDLELQEIGEARLFAVMDEFERLSEAPFRALRAEMDRELSARYGVAVDELRPWHWEDPFAQEAPALGRVELDRYFDGRDPVRVASGFFGGIGLPVEAVLARSDLYEREGKDQHAFCQDIDREGDVRILCNLRPNEKWTGTLLHELGHAVYDELIPSSVPYFLRQPAHTLSTESVAMYFGRLTREPAWLREVLNADIGAADAAEIRGQSRAAMLVSTRWMLVMVHFERALYRDPDRADLNALWWELVERMQLIRHPEARPDGTEWASKIHLSLSPVYYHNYLLGELMASQVTAAVRREAELAPERSIAGEPRVGAFFRDRIFAPGATVDWNGLLVHATGEDLSPRFFVDQFVSAEVR
jgi:peptidyl-dipeptidase A